MNNVRLFLTGDVNVGKTTVIERCLAGYTGALHGFRTWRQDGAAPGQARIWLARAATPGQRHLVAEFDGETRRFYPKVFAGAGVEMLQEIGPETAGLVLMDEIGYIESKAPAFLQQLERVLALDVPVLGVLRKADTPFLHKLFAWQRLTVQEVTPENREALPVQCRQMLGI